MNNLPKVVTQRHLEQDLNLRPVDRKPKRLARCTTAPLHYTHCQQEIRSMERASAQCCFHSIPHIITPYSTYLMLKSCNLDLGRFNVIQDQRSRCQSIAHWWFPVLHSYWIVIIITIIKTTRVSVTEAVSVTGWHCTESRPELETVNK